jgi:DNA polymerase alpha-associated DNA helicase A
MTRLSKFTSSETSSLTQVLFGQSSPTPIPPASCITWSSDSQLNDSQKAAVAHALHAREVALIHGPPGTGKTHTLIALILQLLSRNPTQRVLVCGPSNISVDNIVERLAAHKVPMVRLGHPARLLPSVLNHSLDVLTRTSDAAGIVQDIRTELDSKQASIRKTRSGRERRQIYTEMKSLRTEYRQREKRVVSDLLKSSRVVLSTLHGAGGSYLRDEVFDVVIIDEASQALEAQCWIPVLGVKGVRKLVLAGDHLQLPPTIKSLNLKEGKKMAKTKDVEQGMSNLELEKREGSEKNDRKIPKNESLTLETTLFDRVLSLHGDRIKTMLTTQYRMHADIMAFPSAALYEDKLIAHESVAARLLDGLSYGVEETEDTIAPVVFYDTQGGDFPETLEENSETGSRGKSALLAESKVNENEAALVAHHVARLIEAGVKGEDIAVITPYNGQLALLAGVLKERHPNVELGSVDGFQGREKEAVVLSLVRSNRDGEVGFLGEKRRLNGNFPQLEGYRRLIANVVLTACAV